MRAFMQKRIDALHAEIERLVQIEKAWHRKHHPDDNTLWRHVAETKIEVEAWPPKRREQARQDLT
jgi:hypothetical protein